MNDDISDKLQSTELQLVASTNEYRSLLKSKEVERNSYLYLKYCASYLKFLYNVIQTKESKH